MAESKINVQMSIILLMLQQRGHRLPRTVAPRDGHTSAGRNWDHGDEQDSSTEECNPSPKDTCEDRQTDGQQHGVKGRGPPRQKKKKKKTVLSK